VSRGKAKLTCSRRQQAASESERGRFLGEATDDIQATLQVAHAQKFYSKPGCAKRATTDIHT